jgi:hypothetical protein
MVTSYYFPAFLFAQRAFAATAILARVAADIVRLALAGFEVAGFPGLIFAHLALCAAAMLALPAADILFFLRVPLSTRADAEEPRIAASFFSSLARRSLMAIALRN